MGLFKKKEGSVISRKMVLAIAGLLALLTRIGKAEEMHTEREMELIREMYPFVQVEPPYKIGESKREAHFTPPQVTEMLDRIEQSLKESKEESKELEFELRVGEGTFDILDIKHYLKHISQFEGVLKSRLGEKRDELKRYSTYYRVNDLIPSPQLIKEITENLRNLDRALSLVHDARESIRLIYQYQLDRAYIMDKLSNKDTSQDTIINLKGYVEKLIRGYLNLKELHVHLERALPEPLENDRNSPAAYLSLLMDAMGDEIKHDVERITEMVFGSRVDGEGDRKARAWGDWAERKLRQIEKKLFD